MLPLKIKILSLNTAIWYTKYIIYILCKYLYNGSKVSYFQPHASVNILFLFGHTFYMMLIFRTLFLENNLCSCSKNCEASIEYLLKASDCMDKLQALYNSINVVPTIEQQKSLTEIIKCGEEILCSPNIALLQCYEVAMDGCVEQGDWKGALQYGIKLEHSYKTYLSEYHPSLGLHYFKLG